MDPYLGFSLNSSDLFQPAILLGGEENPLDVQEWVEISQKRVCSGTPDFRNPSYIGNNGKEDGNYYNGLYRV